MFSKIKPIATIALTAILAACGGGGGETQYQIYFSGTVSGLGSGESLTLIGTLPTTSQSTTISVSANGPFVQTITLPSGYNFLNSGKALATIGTKPAGKTCSVSFVSTDNITVNCTSSSTAAGFYTGKFGNLTGTGQILILNDGSYWMWIGASDASTTNFTAVVQSSAGSWTSNAYTSTSGVDLFSTPQATNVGIVATYVAGTSFTGTFTEGTTSGPMTYTVPSSAAYLFTETPSLSKLAGTYALTDGTLSVAATGSFTGQLTSGCTFTGMASPKTTGENAYNLVLTYGPAFCKSPNAQTSGIALLETTVLGTQIVGAVASSDKKTGGMLIGTKK